MVHRVIIEGGNAVGVIVESGGEIFEIRSNEVIISAGAVVSPQLLMLSGIGPAKQLQEHGIEMIVDLPGVGKNLQDHPMAPMMWNTKPQYEFHTDRKRMQMGLRYTADGSDNRNDMIVYVSSFGTERTDRGGDRNTPVGVLLNVTLNMADSRGEIRLASANIDDQPIIDFNYLDKPWDLTRMREGVRKMASLLEQSEFNDIVDSPAYPTNDIVDDDEALNDWIRRDVTTGHHISGSNRMGADSDPMAVVDQLGKVRRVEGLRVVDASIMPTCVRANINATVIAMAERMAELITR